jgi:hypothetical protein
LPLYFGEHTSLNEKPKRPFPDNRFLVRTVEENTDAGRHKIGEISQKKSHVEKTLQTQILLSEAPRAG